MFIFVMRVKKMKQKCVKKCKKSCDMTKCLTIDYNTHIA